MVGDGLLTLPGSPTAATTTKAMAWVNEEMAEQDGNGWKKCRNDNMVSILCKRELKDETLQQATSMGDLALWPPLTKGVESADYEAKRCFEMLCGKNASEPPLGRVPKQAKVEVIDLVMGLYILESVGRH